MVTERGADTPRSAGYATLPMLQGGYLKVTEKSHEADESDNSCYCSLDVCVCGAALLRLVGASRPLAISREGRITGRSSPDTRERCGRRAPAKPAGCLRRRRYGRNG